MIFVTNSFNNSSCSLVNAFPYLDTVSIFCPTILVYFIAAGRISLVAISINVLASMLNWVTYLSAYAKYLASNSSLVKLPNPFEI